MLKELNFEERLMNLFKKYYNDMDLSDFEEFKKELEMDFLWPQTNSDSYYDSPEIDSYYLGVELRKLLRSLIKDLETEAKSITGNSLSFDILHYSINKKIVEILSWNSDRMEIYMSGMTVFITDASGE
jgi:hypothetical protein